MKRWMTLASLLVIATAGFAFAQDEKAGEGEATVDKPIVVMTTSMGDIVIELDRENAPVTVENFLQYAADGHYDGTIFHRVIKGFMVQGGGFTADMEQKSTRPPIKNEANNGLQNTIGTIAMARTNVVDSATSQFFINTVNNRNLNHRAPNPSGFGYCVFGKVIEGMDVVQAIENAGTGIKGRFRDVPTQTITIQSVKLKD